MRCGRAQQLMTAAVDGELAPRRRRALDRHLDGCAACRRELADTERMLAALEALPREAAVSAAVEQTTLRRVRVLAAEEAERAAARSWWRWWQVPAFAAASAAVVALALGILWRGADSPDLGVVMPTPRGDAQVVARAPVPQIAQPVLPPEKRKPRGALPPDPPPALAAAPDLFMDLPILRNMEKLEHFEAIQTTTLGDQPGAPGPDERSSG
jgi:anti-sigma factor RsiW